MVQSEHIRNSRLPISLITAGNQIQANDVVLFLKSGQLVLHRVIGKNKRICLVKGDNEAFLDCMSTEMIIGRVANQPFHLSCGKHRYEKTIQNYRLRLFIQHHELKKFEVTQFD